MRKILLALAVSLLVILSAGPGRRCLAQEMSDFEQMRQGILEQIEAGNYESAAAVSQSLPSRLRGESAVTRSGL